MATEIQTKLDEENVAKALAQFDMDKLVRFFIELIGMLGDVAVRLGTIEEENKEVPEIIKIISSNPKLFLTKILDTATGEEVKTLIRAMLKLDELSPKLSNLFMLKSEEKKKVGTELISISKEIDEAYRKAREKM